MAIKLVECELCDKRCRLAEGQRGDCRVRVNIDGKLITLVYGKVCAAHIDPVEKKPMFHFLPGTKAFSIATAGCNLHCKYCQNWEISQANPEDLQNSDLPPERVVELAINYGCDSIAYTYTEPIIFYEYVYDTCKLARQSGIKNILVTAGFIQQKPLEKLLPYVDGANVDIKGFSDKFYREVCSGRLEPVLRTVKLMKEAGVIVEVTNLVVPTLNDKDDDAKRLVDWMVNVAGADVPLHFSRFFPLYKLKNLAPTPFETLKNFRDIAQRAGVKYAYIGNVAGGEWENTYCASCKNLLVRRVGYQVLSVNIRNGSCKFCGERIYGLWG